MRYFIKTASTLKSPPKSLGGDLEGGIAFARKLFLCLLTVFILTISTLSAQDEEPVTVTTQDYVVMRLGPGVHWERLTVLDFGLTLTATGRTVNTDWLQVAYESPLPADASSDATIDGVTYGWVSTRFLTWRGNLLELPLDGIPTVSTARRAGPQLLLIPDTVYYTDLDFSTRAGVIRNPQFVELTGRIGSWANGYFWMQFKLDGEYYWTATWYSDPPQNYGRVLDASYLFPYGRVFTAIAITRNNIQWKLGTMQNRWNDLAQGYASTCNSIPEQVTLPDVLQSSDVISEPVFNAPINTLTVMMNNLNIAIAQFETMCNREQTERFATSEDVDIALAAIREAWVQLNVLNILLDPIGILNPITSNQ